MSTNDASGSGLHEEKVETVISPPQEQAEKEIIETVSCLQDQTDYIQIDMTWVPATSTADGLGKRWEVKLHQRQLCRAIWKDDWETAKDLFDGHPEYKTDRISQEGDTPLHISAAAESDLFVANLLNLLQPKDLEIKNNDGNTAFCLVAASGNVSLAKLMFEKNPNLPMIPGKNGKLPIDLAAGSDHIKMVDFLFRDIRDESGELHVQEDHKEFFLDLIKIGCYSFALYLLQKDPKLATARLETNGETALHILARVPMKSSNSANQNQQRFLKRFFNLGIDDKSSHNKLPQQELVEQLWGMVKDSDEILEILEKPWRLMFVAAKKGNFEFLNIIISECPELCTRYDKKGRSFVHVAILNRQEDIFRLIEQMPRTVKKVILKHKDDEGNNILHFAGMLAPLDWLNTMSGVALQLQQELLWFEKVREIMNPLDVEAKNNKGKTPEDLFTDKHEKLKEKGEKWMKQTANSCMIAATLIATVVFAAAFTVPGGTKDVTGTPNFIQKFSFKIFIISDAVSLVSSVCSIVIFLSIFTAPYVEKDFRLKLPRKLLIGLSTLLLSIAAMMVVFSATIFIVFIKDQNIWVPILVSVIASLPVILFTKQQWRLLFDVAASAFKISFHELKSLVDDAIEDCIDWILDACRCFS